MDKSKIKITVTIAMLAVLIVSLVALCIGYVDSKDYSKDSNYITDENGNKMENDIVYKMPKNIQFSANDNVTNSVTVMAEIKPTNATNKNILWSLKWSKESLLNVGDYITITPDINDTRICSINVKNAFDIQIILTAISVDNNDIKADCVLDYKQRFDRIIAINFRDIETDEILLKGEFYNLNVPILKFQNKKFYIDFDCEYTKGTVIADDTAVSDYRIKMSFNLPVSVALGDLGGKPYNNSIAMRLSYLYKENEDVFDLWTYLYEKIFTNNYYKPVFDELSNCNWNDFLSCFNIDDPDYGYGDLFLLINLTLNNGIEIEKELLLAFDKESMGKVKVDVSSIVIEDSLVL